MPWGSPFSADLDTPDAAAHSRGARSGGPAPVLALAGVRHRYGVLDAVRGVDLEIREGEIVCLVGPSGCGKSTLLRIAAGLEEVQHGQVWIDDRLVARPGRSLPPERRSVGLVFQDYALFPHLSVLDNVRFGLAGSPQKERKARAMESLEQVGMARYATAYPHMLSGGEQQRVALARAMAPRPKVLLLDEPFSGLDVTLRAQVRDETLHILKARDIATLIVTHDPEEAMFLADRLALMRSGVFEQIGRPFELYNHPCNPFVAQFFGETNRMDAVVRNGVAVTPIGRVRAPGIADGTLVDVLVRPEAVSFSADGVPATVQASRLLGRSSLIHLQVPDGARGSVHIHARAGSQFMPEEGTAVRIDLDDRMAFVFPSAPPHTPAPGMGSAPSPTPVDPGRVTDLRRDHAAVTA